MKELMTINIVEILQELNKELELWKYKIFLFKNNKNHKMHKETDNAESGEWIKQMNESQRN